VFLHPEKACEKRHVALILEELASLPPRSAYAAGFSQRE
jgi:hypothetical protein